MRSVMIVATLVACAALGVGAAVALGGNPHGEPPGQGPCSHGATGKECKPDPNPDHGKDCEEHGNHGGVNEDHCGPTDTTPTDTTPTTPTETTATETTPSETTPTTPSGPRCPPGMEPTAGKDGASGNDECELPKQPDSTPPASGTQTTAAVVVAGTTTTVVTSSAGPVTVKPKASPKPKAAPKPDKPPVVVKVTRKAHGVVVIKTSDGKTHTGVMGSG